MLDYELDPDDVHVGPSDHVPWLLDRKWCYIRMEGTTFGDVPLNAELKLEVWDSPNSAGVITDAIRCLKLGLDRGLKGTLVAPSSYFMKSPPQQIHDDIAFNRVEAFIRGEDNETLVGHREAGRAQAAQARPATKAKVAHRGVVTAEPDRPTGRRPATARERRSRRRIDATGASPRVVERLARRRLSRRCRWIARGRAARTRPRPIVGRLARSCRTSPGRPSGAGRTATSGTSWGCRRTIRASGDGPARLPARTARYLVELMRLPTRRPSELAGARAGPRRRRASARLWREAPTAAG